MKRRKMTANFGHEFWANRWEAQERTLVRLWRRGGDTLLTRYWDLMGEQAQTVVLWHRSLTRWITRRR